MKAIILAAGQGTRLRPLTNDKPKCLVEVGGKSILQHQIDVMNACGITDVHVIGGYKHEQLARNDVTVHINPNYLTTNMVSTLFCASNEFNAKDDIIISYGDIVYQKNVLETLISNKSPVSIAVDLQWFRYWQARMEDPLDDAETLKMNDEYRITEIGKKTNDISDIQAQYTGLIKVRSDFTEQFKNNWFNLEKNKIYDDQDIPKMYMTDFIQYLIDIDWYISAEPIQNGWAEIDCVSDLVVATEFWKA